MELRTVYNSNGVPVYMEPAGEETRKAVLIPAIEPEGRTSDESYRAARMRGITYVPNAQGSGYYFGPYVVLWEDRHVVSNPDVGPLPDWRDREAYRTWSAHANAVGHYLPNEYIVTQHDEDAGTMEVLLRTTDRKEANAFFADLEVAYPEGPKQWGGKREGAGHPTTIGKSRSIPVDMPSELLAKLDDEVQRQKDGGIKISRNELIRELLASGLKPESFIHEKAKREQEFAKDE